MTSSDMHSSFMIVNVVLVVLVPALVYAVYFTTEGTYKMDIFPIIVTQNYDQRAQ
jgi:hypothetical protein